MFFSSTTSRDKKTLLTYDLDIKDEIQYKYSM